MKTVEMFHVYDIHLPDGQMDTDSLELRKLIWNNSACESRPE